MMMILIIWVGSLKANKAPAGVKAEVLHQLSSNNSKLAFQ